MTTKAELESKIEKMEKYISSLIAERGIFYTELLKIAIQYKENKCEAATLFEFLNPTPLDILSL